MDEKRFNEIAGYSRSPVAAYQRYKRKIGPNEKCPCDSGKNIKNAVLIKKVFEIQKTFSKTVKEINNLCQDCAGFDNK